ncbi:MAG: ATP-binding protein, partial [Myxococcota bacterium]
ERFVELFEHLLDGIVILEPVEDGADFIISSINRALPGLEPASMIGRPLSETFPAVLRTPAAEDLRRVAHGGEGTTRRGYTLEWNGETRYLDYSAFKLPGGDVVVIHQDRTSAFLAEQEREEIRDTLLATQKLESLGVMAGGIAHDFNNLLMGVLANADAASARLDDPAFLRECLADIKLASRRAAELCRQLLDYAGQTRVNTHTLDANAVLRELDPLIEAAVTGNTELHVELEPGELRVTGDAERLKQVAINLVSNASEAHASEIRLTTERKRLEAACLARAHLGAHLPAGEYCCIRVHDNGEGIPQRDRSRVFDPFFTTRFTGRGLGLSAVAGVVRAHHGAIFLESTLGVGTSISIALPLADAVRAHQERKDSAPLASGFRILLVDDDDATRRSVRRLLELDRLAVTEAADGYQAVERAKEQVYDVVLLDLTMPRRGGLETFPELATLLPNARIVLMSGYDASAEGVGDIQSHPSFGGFLPKPYTLEMLREAVSGLTPSGH